jgi:hypothetical protein
MVHTAVNYQTFLSSMSEYSVCLSTGHVTGAASPPSVGTYLLTAALRPCLETHAACKGDVQSPRWQLTYV